MYVRNTCFLRGNHIVEKISIINERLQTYKINNIEDQENALKEILQEIALYALSTTDFFEHALFQGGTSLRILYNLPRFSEDLDFILKIPDKNFNWKQYLDSIIDGFKLFGIAPEIADRSGVNKAIQTIFLKDNSIGKIISLNFKNTLNKKLKIKFEIDINPPLGSKEEIKFLDFPVDFSITSQDLTSNFAGKCHALLCRPYTKGRDWFDFTWYVTKKTNINFPLLEAALNQFGPFKNLNTKIDTQWLVNALTQKIETIDWIQARSEVEKFINPMFKDSLKLWGIDFFIAKIKTLEQNLILNNKNSPY